MPETTANGAMMVRMFIESGSTPYPMPIGESSTSKIARLVMPNGNPVAIQTNCKSPRVWLLPKHDRGAFIPVGKNVSYAADQPRHHHLNQVREFAGRALTKVEVRCQCWADIRHAVEATCARAVRI